MGKITIKHYLNTKLNSVTIKGEKYYSVYVQVTVKRKTTQIKSKIFNGYCSENGFLEESQKENNIIDEESETIKNIIETQLNLYNEFDTLLFSAFYNFMDKFKINDVYFKTIDGEKLINVNTYYDIYKPQTQQQVIKLNLNPFNTLEKFNMAYFVLFFDILNVVSKTNKKYALISEKYSKECENPTELFKDIYVLGYIK